MQWGATSPISLVMHIQPKSKDSSSCVCIEKAVPRYMHFGGCPIVIHAGHKTPKSLLYTCSAAECIEGH